MRVMRVLAPRECHACLAMATREWYMSHKQTCVTLPVICTVWWVLEAPKFCNAIFMSIPSIKYNYILHSVMVK